ncbi:MAG: flippase activity-associated protein Agl23, partial [Acidimicrobiales bacterium]
MTRGGLARRRRRLDRRWLVVAGLTAVSLVAHLWRLGERPLAHDEAIDAWFSWQARSFGVMRYDPVYHGPLRFYLEGPVLRLFGTGAFQARLVAALAGAATTALIAASTRTLGRIGAPAAAVMFLVSPTALTVTRTGREDSLVALVSVALLLLVARLLAEPRPAHVVGAGVLLAVSFGLKETTFLFGFAALVFLAVAGIVAAARPGAARLALGRFVALGRIPSMWAVIAFLATFIVIFTAAFRYAEGFESGLLDGVRYWWSQHDVRRGGQPWFFYVLIYAAYEWLVLAFAVAGAVVTVRRRLLPGVWLATMFAVQLLVFTWAGEKFAWLALHPLL